VLSVAPITNAIAGARDKIDANPEAADAARVSRDVSARKVDRIAPHAGSGEAVAIEPEVIKQETTWCVSSSSTVTSLYITASAPRAPSPVIT